MKLSFTWSFKPPDGICVNSRWVVWWIGNLCGWEYRNLGMFCFSQIQKHSAWCGWVHDVSTVDCFMKSSPSGLKNVPMDIANDLYTHVMYIHIHCTYLQHPIYQHLWLSGHFFFRFLLGGFSHERHATMVYALETKHSEKSEAEIERQKQVRIDSGTTWALFAVYGGLYSPVLYRDYFKS